MLQQKVLDKPQNPSAGVARDRSRETPKTPVAALAARSGFTLDMAIFQPSIGLDWSIVAARCGWRRRATQTWDQMEIVKPSWTPGILD